MDKFKIISVKNINNLPTTAGVYAFYNSSLQANSYKLQPIYIGKAINIKNRVKNHFSSPTYKDNAYINQIEKIGFIETGSEIQALILEASLIKQNQPKFNQVWRDDKNYFFVAIAQTLRLSSGQAKEKIPYLFITHQPEGKAIGPFVDGNALKKTIRFLRKVFPYYTTSKHSKLKCTYCHLDLCPGPYDDGALRHGSGQARWLDYKKNIKKLILVLEGKSFKVLNSLKKEMKLASLEQNFERASKARDQIFALEKIISHKIQNNQYTTIQRPLNYSIWENTEKTLQQILDLKKPITKVECYDVSNIQGKFATASMIVFTNGKPDKNQYKKFRIKMENKPNDIAMLREVLQRRFVHIEWPYPEVILIDGGKAQLNIAINSKPQNSNIKILSIAKGRQELFIENKENPIPLKDLPQEIYNLVKNLDDEAHRFAVTYHKKLRKQNLLNNY
jgi:excinuclease ABC subunit C